MRKQSFLYVKCRLDLINIPINLHEDILTDRQLHAMICPLYKNVHTHTVIKFLQYFKIGYQVMPCSKFVCSKLA